MLDLDAIGMAKSYPLHVLSSLTPGRLDTFDFTGFPESHGIDALNLLFPKNAKYGKLDPTPEYLKTDTAVRR